MEALLAEFLRSLAQGKPSPDILGRVGDTEPTRAADAFARAARHPDLAPSRESWAPALLLAARPGAGAQRLEELASRYHQTRRRPLAVERLPALPLVLGSSEFLARLLLRHPHWAEELEGEPPAAPADVPLEPDWTSIRIAKYRALLRIAARDLLGRPFAESLEELSGLADRCLAAGLECAARQTETRAPALLALGKLGGRELNFSSDVDLLFLYEEPPDAQRLEREAQVMRLVQTLKRNLEAPSEDGFGYRVDLDLRPEGRTGALANSIEGALHYYEGFGAEWERQMLIRLRPVAGPSAVADAFVTRLLPFVYRRLIDPGTIGAVRQMKMRIEEERRREGHELDLDLKEGPGGIRDIEFLVQALQLLLGGREPSVRTGNVLAALAALERLGALPEGVAAELTDAYLWLRRAEHSVQMVEERQTARFPRDREAQVALARRMGYREPIGARACDRLLDDWTNVRTEVRGHFAALVLETDRDRVA